MATVTEIPDLWPSVIEPDPLITPVQILRQQAVNLGEKTHQIVVADVDTTSVPVGSFSHSALGQVAMRHDFYLSAPLIGYRVVLLRVLHGLSPYPALMQVMRPESPGQMAGEHLTESPESFLGVLKIALSDPVVLSTVRSLISFSRDAEPARVQSGS